MPSHNQSLIPKQALVEKTMLTVSDMSVKQLGVG